MHLFAEICKMGDWEEDEAPQPQTIVSIMSNCTIQCNLVLIQLYCRREELNMVHLVRNLSLQLVNHVLEIGSVQSVRVITFPTSLIASNVKN